VPPPAATFRRTRAAVGRLYHSSRIGGVGDSREFKSAANESKQGPEIYFGKQSGLTTKSQAGRSSSKLLGLSAANPTQPSGRLQGCEEAGRSEGKKSLFSPLQPACLGIPSTSPEVEEV
jgi:hypothetical protein